MSMRWSSGLSDLVTCAHAGMDDLPQWTWVAWMVLNATPSAGVIIFLSKGSLGTTQGTKLLRVNTSRQINARARHATDATDYVTNETLTVGVPYFIAAAFDPSAGANNKVHVYLGTINTPPTECTFSSVTEGTGAYSGDSADPFRIGGASLFGGIPQTTQMVSVFNTILPASDILAVYQGSYPKRSRSCKGWYYPGRNGSLAVLDESGSGNHGITGGTVAQAVDFVPPRNPIVGPPPADFASLIV